MYFSGNYIRVLKSMDGLIYIEISHCALITKFQKYFTYNCITKNEYTIKIIKNIKVQKRIECLNL